jgi:succinyl-CoA synthetase alpha subunit
VSPGREGSRVGDVPVFGSVRAAREATGADTAIVFVPPAAVLGATLEAIESGCRLVVATADELPVQDAIEIRAAAKAHGAAFVGPNTPGLISPGKAKLGFMPSFCSARQRRRHRACGSHVMRASDGHDGRHRRRSGQGTTAAGRELLS